MLGGSVVRRPRLLPHPLTPSSSSSCPPPSRPQADLQKQVQRERALAEAEGRIKEARENEDVNRRAALLKYQEETRKGEKRGGGGFHS